MVYKRKKREEKQDYASDPSERGAVTVTVTQKGQVNEAGFVREFRRNVQS